MHYEDGDTVHVKKMNLLAVVTLMVLVILSHVCLGDEIRYDHVLAHAKTQLLQDIGEFMSKPLDSHHTLRLQEFLLSKSGRSLSRVSGAFLQDDDSTTTYTSTQTLTPEYIKDYERMYSLFSSLANSTTFQEKFWQRQPLLLPRTTFLQCVKSDEKDVNNHYNNTDYTLFPFSMENDFEPLFRHHKKIYFPTLKETIIQHNSWFPSQSHYHNDPDYHYPHGNDTSYDYSSHEHMSYTWSQLLSSPVTMHLDHASSFINKLQHLALITDFIFGLPSGINVYYSPYNLTQSTPHHTDEQDIFIIQTHGRKHWKVYSPPDASRDITCDPFNRGKVGDVIAENELRGALIIDQTLDVGDFLYIPKGFVHSTHTHISQQHADSSSCSATSHHHDLPNQHVPKNDTYSLHLTIGIDSHFYALTYGHLRWIVLNRSNKDLGSLDVSLEGHWDAMKTLLLGFLSSNTPTLNNNTDIQETDRDENINMRICTELKRIMMILEPHRWKIHQSKSKIIIDNNNNSMDNMLREDLPSDEVIIESIQYIRNVHLPWIMAHQKEKYQDHVNIHDLKNVLYYQKEWLKESSRIMKEFWTFGKDEYMKEHYDN